MTWSRRSYRRGCLDRRTGTGPTYRSGRREGWGMAESNPSANRPPETRARRKGQFQPGVSGNPSGKPKKLREIEAMLDAEHRTVENMREVYARLKELALG